MPAIGEILLSFDPLHLHFHGQVLIPGMGDLAADGGSFDERPVQFYREPSAELLGVRNGTPYARAWRPKGDLLFDAICVGYGHVQPPGCKSSTPIYEMQPKSCVNRWLRNRSSQAIDSAKNRR